MEARKARQVTMRIISERRAKEKASRDNIETNMEGVYAFIEKCSLDGKFSCAFPLNTISSKAEDELRMKGFELSINDSIGGKVLSVKWLDI